MSKEKENVPSHRIGAALWQADRAFSIALERTLKPEGIGMTQALALIALRNQPGLSGAALARFLRITAQSAGTLLTQLDQQGLVVKRPHAVHRAIVEAFLSEEGEAKLARVQQIFADFDAQIAEHLSLRERDELYRALQTCLKAATDMISDDKEWT